jgi:hypothetical protein
MLCAATRSRYVSQNRQKSDMSIIITDRIYVGVFYCGCLCAAVLDEESGSACVESLDWALAGAMVSCMHRDMFQHH